MTEWGVVGVIVVLLGLIVSVVKPLISLNAVLTRLTDAIKVLEKELSALSEKNGEAHNKLWIREREQDEILRDHEFRLLKIENSEK